MTPRAPFPGPGPAPFGGRGLFLGRMHKNRASGEPPGIYRYNLLWLKWLRDRRGGGSVVWMRSPGLSCFLRKRRPGRVADARLLEAPRAGRRRPEKARERAAPTASLFGAGQEKTPAKAGNERPGTHSVGGAGAGSSSTN